MIAIATNQKGNRMKCKICNHDIANTNEWVHTFLRFTYKGKQRDAKRVYKKKCWCGCQEPVPLFVSLPSRGRE